jgi:predicted transposase/invertase (TIGR01784 family)
MQRRAGDFDTNLINRVLYYLCRAVSTQKIVKMNYQKLCPVVVSFILSEHKSSFPVEELVIYNKTRNEVQGNLITAKLVNVPAVVKNGSGVDVDLVVFGAFFSVSSQSEADTFVKSYGDTALGKELIIMYNQSTINVLDLENIGEQSYFVTRLSEEEIEEEREEAMQTGKQKGMLEAAKNFLKIGVSPEQVAQCTNLPLETVISIQKQ